MLALVLELLILHVAVLGGMGCAACAAERDGGGPGARMGQMPHMQHMQHESHAPHQQHARHDAPAPRHQHDGAQCVAADGCAVAATTTVSTELVATVAGPHARIVVADEQLGRSARAAPEPPPPRA